MSDIDAQHEDWGAPAEYKSRVREVDLHMVYPSLSDLDIPHFERNPLYPFDSRILSFLPWWFVVILCGWIAAVLIDVQAIKTGHEIMRIQESVIGTTHIRANQTQSFLKFTE